MPHWWNLANFFTLLRLLLTPLVIYAVVDGRHQLALAFSDCGAYRHTRWLGSPAARRLNPRRRLLRPHRRQDSHERCIYSSCCRAPRALVVCRHRPWQRCLHSARGGRLPGGDSVVRHLPPSVWGKASTFVQIITVTCWMARDAFPGAALDSLSYGILWPCVAITAWSGLYYTWRGISLAGGKGQNEIDAPPERE